MAEANGNGNGKWLERLLIAALFAGVGWWTQNNTARINEATETAIRAGEQVMTLRAIVATSCRGTPYGSPP